MPSWRPKSNKNEQRSRELGSEAPPPPYGSTLSRDGSTYERVASAAHHADPYKFLTDFLNSNPSLVSSATSASFLPGTKSLSPVTDPFHSLKEVEESVDNFSDTAKTLVKGLTALGHIHPFVGIAVGAFALVVTLDLTRRENDRKVTAVKVQMCDLMSVFFELRHIKSSDEKGPDGTSIAERLTPLMRDIAKDVKECGAACDAISKKGFLAKTVKAGIYEGRLAEFTQTFLDRRKSLELALALHSAIGIDSANAQLAQQKEKLDGIDRKLETMNDMMTVFRKLDTPRERDVRKFIEENGGAKAVVGNDELLEELVTRSGESLSQFSSSSQLSSSGAGGGRKTNDLPEIRKKLVKELQEDIDEAFGRNMVLFEKKLDIQSRQLVESMREESEVIIAAVLAGAHDRITDPDLQTIWKDMGWKGSVKARHFVLALHDYYTDQLSLPDSSVSISSSGLPTPTPGTPNPNSGSRASMLALPSPGLKKKQDDEWALAYINAAYVQPILEAVDDDGTGFVSVKEVNTFVAERPEGWGLPKWIAYWAVGWQVSMSRYKSKIYQLVQTMFRTLAHVLPSNRRAVDEYLFHSSFWRIELLLRSTRSAGGKIEGDTDLLKATVGYERLEEERLEEGLREVGYELDTPATVALMTGAGRIERYVMPLLFLLLKRHLKVITLACKHVVHTDEFATLTESLVSILLAIEQRMQNLEAIFKQTHLDVQAPLGNFAFGMFQLSYGDIKRCPVENSFATWVDIEGDSSSKRRLDLAKEDVIAAASEVSHDILKYGIQDGYSVTDYFEFEPHRLITQSPLQGTWTGHYIRDWGDEHVSCMLRLSIRVSSNARRCIGKGEDFAEAFDFSGNISNSGDGTLEITFLVVNDKDGTSRQFSGSLDVASGVLTAYWTAMQKDGSSRDSIADMFELRCTEPTLLRYRYNPVQFAEDPARSRWSFACAAALHQAQEKLWSRRFFETRFTERKRYVELTTRSLIVEQGLTPQTPLSAMEKAELEYLRQELNPSEARFYQALAEFEIQKLPWHPSWGCDWCERQITKRRLLCVQCMSEDHADNIDLCETCIDKAPIKRTFTHQVTHSMLQVEQTLHDFDLVRMVEAARTTSERIKNRFRTQEPPLTLHTDEDSSSSGDRLLCACCGVATFPSCWACVVCTRDTVICRECNAKRNPSRLDAHLTSHPLVRICDTSVDGEVVSTEERMVALEQRLHLMEIKVAKNLEMMESRVTERLNSMEAKMEERLAQMESKMDQRLDGLEALLRHIAAQTAALPAVYGTVVRDYSRTHTIRNSH